MARALAVIRTTVAVHVEEALSAAVHMHHDVQSEQRGASTGITLSDGKQ